MRGGGILVLGVTGMLGHKIFQRVRASFPGTVGLARGRAGGDPLAAVPLLAGNDVRWGFEVEDPSALRSALDELRPRIVINCLGIVKQREEAKAAVPSIAVNALLPHWLGGHLLTWGGRLIHFSTDCVFDGRKGSYEETDSTSAEDLYGRTKALGEVNATNALTLRTSIVGRELRERRGLIEWFLSQRGGRIRGFRKVIYSGVTTIEMARLVERLVVGYPLLSGICHVAGEPISKMELLSLVNEAFDSRVEIEPEDETVLDRSLRADRFREATGWQAPGWREMIEELAADPTPYSEWQAIAARAPKCVSGGFERN